jgi:hypothetical protein
MNDDATLIRELGGAAKVAARFGYTKQRVHNWLVRGIPAAEKLKHADILLPQLNQQQSRSVAPQPATSEG